MPTKKIKTFEEACKALNQDPTLPEYPMLSEAEKKAAIAHYKLVIIARALNGNWKPDWTNWNENKYFPWFDFRGGRFVFINVYYNCTNSNLGSRLCYKDEETAEYVGRTFTDLYHEYFHIE